MFTNVLAIRKFAACEFRYCCKRKAILSLTYTMPNYHVKPNMKSQYVLKQ